ncbi:MAG: hypothetical protein ACFFAS_02730 [Promethearchaeota archaeon]
MIINYLKDKDYGVSKTELANALQMYVNKVSKYLDKIENFRIVIKRNDYNKTLYFLDN